MAAQRHRDITSAWTTRRNAERVAAHRDVDGRSSLALNRAGTALRDWRRAQVGHPVMSGALLPTPQTGHSGG
jgi:hypothetical protein